MIEIVNYTDTEVEVRPSGDEPTSKFEYVPLDIEGKTPHEAFLLGMAYSLLKNRGIEIPQPEQGVVTKTSEETEVI